LPRPIASSSATFAVAAALSRSHVAIASSCGRRSAARSSRFVRISATSDRSCSSSATSRSTSARSSGSRAAAASTSAAAAIRRSALAIAARWRPSGRAPRGTRRRSREVGPHALEVSRRGIGRDDRGVEVPDPDVDRVPRGTLRRELGIRAGDDVADTDEDLVDVAELGELYIEAVIRCAVRCAPRVDVAGELAGPGLGARVPLEAEDLAEDPLPLGRRRLGESVRLALGEQDGRLERVGVEPEQLADRRLRVADRVARQRPPAAAVGDRELEVALAAGLRRAAARDAVAGSEYSNSTRTLMSVAPSWTSSSVFARATSNSAYRSASERASTCRRRSADEVTSRAPFGDQSVSVWLRKPRRATRSSFTAVRDSSSPPTDSPGPSGRRRTSVTSNAPNDSSALRSAAGSSSG
jgi:hypothetical protein